MKKKSKKPPLILTIIRSSIRVITKVSPYLVARMVNYFWFKTRRSPEPKREIDILKSACWEKISIDSKVVQLYIWGKDNHPSILLVHGWNGRAAHFGAFVPSLVAKGYRVIGFDAPGHGRSEGNSTNIPAVNIVIRRIEHKFGSFHSAISHSFGSMCLMYAIEEGLQLQKICCIAPVPNIESLQRMLASLLKIEPRVVSIQKQILENKFGTDMWDKFSVLKVSSQLSSSGLIIHDKNDKEIPIISSKLIARAWKSSELLVTTTLGHHRILRNKFVVEKVVTYIFSANK